jgi:hypothetical protein
VCPAVDPEPVVLTLLVPAAETGAQMELADQAAVVAGLGQILAEQLLGVRKPDTVGPQPV